MSLINGIHHISLKCSSEEQYKTTVAFYHEVLELPVIRVWDKGTMLGSEKGIVEIFNNGTEDLPQGVIRHFAFSVGSADACVKRVKDAGYEVFDGPRDVDILSEPPYPVRVAFCRGPLGEEIEFFEERHETKRTSAGDYQDTTDILVIEGLCKEYPAFALDHVSFTVKSGRIMGFIGRNGAGKTTTLKCALGLVQPSAGSIRFFGMERKDHEREIKQEIGFSSGGVNYFTKKKIRDIAEVTKAFYENWDEAAYREYLNLFGLDENKTPDQISAGMKVKLNLTFALSHHAKLLLLDEPTSGLDPVSRDEIMTIFEYLRSKGCAILFSTHVTSDLDRCADDITYIREGRIIASMPKEQFISENRQYGSNVEDIMIHYEHDINQQIFNGEA